CRRRPRPPTSFPSTPLFRPEPALARLEGGPPALEEVAPARRRVRPAHVREVVVGAVPIGREAESGAQAPPLGEVHVERHGANNRSEEHTSELQPPRDIVCRL